MIDFLEGCSDAKATGFFDLEDRYAELSKAGDPFEKLGNIVNFEAFRYRLNKALKRSDGSQGGRPAYDVVLMFKILVLQSLYNLPDERTEFTIRDRLSFLRFSFMRFLGIGVRDPVPDATTIWLFRDHLTQANAVEKLFARVEHVFAVQKGTMGLFIRSIGLARARTRIGLANLSYDMKRLIYLNARVAPT